jgi:ribosomal protein S18 acetylase RimI-like enzyme
LTFQFITKTRRTREQIPELHNAEANPLQYRKANRQDARALAEFGGRLFVDSYHHLMARDELADYVRENFTIDRQQAELLDARLTTFLALDDGIIGYAQIAVGSRPECALMAVAPAELKRIYVDRSRHGQGVAGELLRLVKQQAQVCGCDALWLAVWEVNDRAISFYGKSGFQQIGRQGFPIGNEVQSDLVMAMPLANELH